MFDRWLGFEIHKYLQVLGLFIAVVGIPLNRVVMSIGTIWLAANLLIKADFKTYWKRWKKNGVFWFLALFLLMHFVGLIYSTDLNYGFRDIKPKITLIVIPLSLIGFPIERKWLKFIFIGFLTSLLVTSFVNFNFILENPTANYREFSRFGSHIRYSLFIVTGIALLLYFSFQRPKYSFVFLPFMGWFIYYLMISEVTNGYIAFFFLWAAVVVFLIQKIPSFPVRIASMLGVVAIVFIGSWQTYQFFKPDFARYEFGDLPETTQNGNLYFHDTTSRWFENEHHIFSYISQQELAEKWNQRSALDFHHVFENGYEVNNYLIRYMTSKGLSKDAEGMDKMTQEDIENVENQITSVVVTYPFFQRQIAKTRNQFFNYANGADPNGSSMAQHFEHWRAAQQIIQENWWLGVGTGDVQLAFNEVYQQNGTLLTEENWKRTHNQFLTFWVTFGVVGFLFFLGFWLYFLVQNIQLNNFLGIAFSLIIIGSFLTEDTIETQQGVTYAAVFLGLITLMNTRWKKDVFKKKQDED